MNKNNSIKKTNVGLIPRIARKIGERSANQTCAWWSHQPSVPKLMINSK